MTLPGVGDFWTAAEADQVLDPLADQTLLFVPGGSTTSATTGGQQTWLTLGNITVPTWATKCIVTVLIGGITTAGAGVTTTLAVKIGSATGSVNRRMTDPAVSGQRWQWMFADLVTSLSTGSQSVTLATTWTAGVGHAVDTNSTVTTTYRFQP